MDEKNSNKAGCLPTVASENEGGSHASIRGEILQGLLLGNVITQVIENQARIRAWVNTHLLYTNFIQYVIVIIGLQRNYKPR